MTREPRAFAVVDLGFGDGGKGLVTDFLVRRSAAAVVVRFNGGAQAGHNVVSPDGRHHTFAQLGAGSFVPGVRTFLSRHVLIHPTALVVEAGVLAGKGVPDPLARVRVSERAPVITPFHQAANRLRELARGEARHGSCGVGIGETAAHALANPDEAVLAADWRDRAVLRGKLRRIRDRLRPVVAEPRLESADTRRERAVFEDDAVIERWIGQVAPLAGLVAPDPLLAGWIREGRSVVFEGAQGLLLDQAVGFHPFCTWSDCTPGNARALLAEAVPGLPLQVWAVARAHAVRHGAGPLPTESAEVRPRLDHNAVNDWQGPVRYGWLDVGLLRHALDLTGEIDALVLTHVDLLGARDRWPVAIGYVPESGAAAARLLDDRGRLVAEAGPSIERQRRMAALLQRCRVQLEQVPGAEPSFLDRIADLLGRDITAISRGPCANDVALR